MKKSVLVFISLSISIAILFNYDFANATSGACSWHDGVNCSMGRQLNGKVYCNDGWTGSMTDYEFMVECQDKDYNCTLEEWEGLSQKYGLENIYFQMQDITEKMLYNPLLQIQYNALKKQYETGLMLAEGDCSALGADRADQLNYEGMKLEFYNEQIKAEQDKLAQLEEEERKLTEDYLAALNDLNDYTQNIPQYTCPANSTLNGTKCTCNNGYTVYNNQCVTYTDYCSSNYGDHVFVKMINDRAHCDCEVGYIWNQSVTACIKEVRQIQSSPKIVVQKTDEFAPIKNEGTSQVDREQQLQAGEQQIQQNQQEEGSRWEEIISGDENIDNKEPEKQNSIKSVSLFITNTLNNVKNFFHRIFYWR